MASKARLGFIGLGTMGRDLLREAVKLTKVEVAALCDIDPEALADASQLCGTPPATYADYAEMLKRERLHGAVVAVPQYPHAQVSIDALDAGLHTFCEKPMAMNVAQCARMIAAAERNGKGLMIGQVLQYMGHYRYVLERIRSGEFGRPLAMRCIRSSSRFGSWLRPWRQKEATSGGALLEINAHELDLMLRVLGPAAAVSAIGKHFANDEVDFEDFVAIRLTFANGGLGSFVSVQWDHIGKNSAEVFLEKGTIYYDSVSRAVYLAADGQECQSIPYANIHPEWENGVYREMREFAEACLGEGPITIPGEDGLRAVELAQAAYTSLREGRTVPLPLPAEP